MKNLGFIAMPLLLVAGCGASQHAALTADATPARDQLAASVAPAPLPYSLNPAMCIDVLNGNTTSGTPVQLYHCNNLPTQLWQFKGGLLQALGKCLTVSATPGNGVPLVLSDCMGGDTQTWEPRPSQAIRLVGTNFCVDLPDGVQKDFTQLQLYSCSGQVNQAWVLPPVAPEGAEFVVPGTSHPTRCLDETGGVPVDGQAVRIWDCNDSHAQHWAFNAADGTLRVDGMCLDDPAGAKHAGDKLQIWTCLGQANQQFYRLGNSIRLKDTNLCVISAGKPDKGAGVTLDTCDPRDPGALFPTIERDWQMPN